MNKKEKLCEDKKECCKKCCLTGKSPCTDDTVMDDYDTEKAMKDYIGATDSRIIKLVMKDTKGIAPNVPPEVTWRNFFLRMLIRDVQEQLRGTEYDRLADDLGDCLRLSGETFELIEAGFDSLCVQNNASQQS